MAERALVVEDSRAVAEALEGQLARAGFEVDVVPSAHAVPRLRPDHTLALVRAERLDVLRALREADPELPLIAVFGDAEAASAGAPPEASGVLVAPLSEAAVAATARATVRLRAQARRIAELEESTARANQAEASVADVWDLAFLRRLLLVEVKRARRYQYPLGIALLDLDGWDRLAAPLAARDRAALLGDVLAVVAGAVRDIDLPLFPLGDRIVVFMPHTGPEGALAVARRLCERVRARVRPPAVTASVGVAAYGGDGDVSISLLVRQAVRGVEAARAQGGDRAVLAGPPTDAGPPPMEAEQAGAGKP
jgi:two-component system, cell cycle response regulator